MVEGNLVRIQNAIHIAARGRADYPVLQVSVYNSACATN
jgi:hypothetical protein